MSLAALMTSAQTKHRCPPGARVSEILLAFETLHPGSIGRFLKAPGPNEEPLRLVLIAA